MTSTDTRGETEFRTVALLLAIVLVVAVALGVFINTIVAMQDEVDNSADEAITISNQSASVNDPTDTSVEVSDGVGNDGDPVVYELRIELQHASGEVDLTDLHVELSGDAVGVLDHISTNVEDGDLAPDGDVDGTDVARDSYFLQPVAAAEPDGILRDGDRYELVIPMGVFIDHDGALTDSPVDGQAVTTPERGYDDADVVAGVPAFLDDGEGLDNSGAGLLEASDIVSVTITTEHGAAETVDFQVPDTLEDNAGGAV